MPKLWLLPVLRSSIHIPRKFRISSTPSSIECKCKHPPEWSTNRKVLSTAMNGIPLHLLPNSIEWAKSTDGRINVTLRTEPFSPTSIDSNCNSKQSTSNSQSDEGESCIPESVLQYQRQLRKVQASERSTAPLNIQDHLNVLDEDEHLIVVNKPSGVLCVPGLNNKPNLLDLVRQHLNERQSTTSLSKDRLFDQDPSRMIVHRLDMDTSGIVVFAKTEYAMKSLQSKFRDRTSDILKEYHALVCGHLPLSWPEVGGHIRLPLQRDHRHPPFMRIATPRSEEEARNAVQDLQTHGFQKLVKKNPKPSHTEFEIMAREWLRSDGTRVGSVTCTSIDLGPLLPVTRVHLIPHTGRTHQLRVHMAALGYPILGDPAYGLHGEADSRGGCCSSGNDEAVVSTLGASLDLQKQLQKAWPTPDKPMCLHAARLGMDHPITGKTMLWEASGTF
jgi:tRNA pseudouridine32 synthase / 23S rRNA pseudouridine746 synthase